MKPLKLIMHAFGSYGEKTTIDFEKVAQNLFLITGDTGSGKTTIFDAIVFALYGEASSGANKKEGVVLQSQFAHVDTEPYVELTFAEEHGSMREEYTVRRVPRHLKTITKGSNKGGVTEVTGSITLTMPDGTEYPSKEANAKLEEIVGLTKSQFMQVAMIAQGEFMELLRAKSDEKKVIFRKLFNTGLYQNIVDELNNRKKAKEKDIAIIKTECQTVVGGVKIPQDYELFEELNVLKKSIIDGQLSRIGEFLEGLDDLCKELEEKKRLAELDYEVACENRDVRMTAYTNAESLLKFYEQLEKAERDIQECQAEEAEIQKMIALISMLRYAYEIKAEYERLQDAEKTLNHTKEELKKQQDALPALTEKVTEYAEHEAKDKAEFDRVNDHFSKTSVRVNQALDNFEKIKNTQKTIIEKSSALEKAETDAKRTKKALADFEVQEKEWRKQFEELSDVESRLIRWEIKNQEVEGLEKDVQELKDLQGEVAEQRKAVEQSTDAYAKAREKYDSKCAAYEQMRRAFLDAQAGFIAKSLVPGMPCPVCGSKEHPEPCKWDDEHENLSEEAIEQLEREVEKLRIAQEELSAKARADKDVLATKQESWDSAFEKLCHRMIKNISEQQVIQNLEHAEEIIEGWKVPICEEGRQLREKEKQYQKLQTMLQGVDAARGKLKVDAERADATYHKVTTELEGCKATLRSLEEAKDYDSEAEARQALYDAEQERKKWSLAYNTTKDMYEKAKVAMNHSETLIQTYKRDLPTQEELCVRRRNAYEKAMEENALLEKEWKELTEAYAKTAIEDCQIRIDAYNRKMASAEHLKKAAMEAIGDQVKPNLEELAKVRDDAERQRKDAEVILEAFKTYCKDNTAVYNILAPKMENRKKIVEEHAKLDTLYRLVSGNVSGSRMDLETYVQRYYLEKILYAANRRFQNMSAGQFELRMYDLEKAGEGKNRGLDLMVYSAVTGKEREVRTLSGGESFMAALALALGMADQIQENSAAINLDIMFIDEGFGTLDEHSRNQAVKVLLEMAEGSKLIGIISHVTELKQEIEAQLLVSKDEKGSHVKWEIS